MKKAILWHCLLLVSCSGIFAQTTEIVRIKAGEDIASGFSPYGFYRFPTFSEGVAVFKNGGQTRARFNYHMLNEEVQFISPKGDTLALAEPFSLKQISIDTNLFYYSDGYMEVIDKDENLKLGKKLRLNTKWEKIGGYGQPSPSGSIRSPNRLILGNNSSNLSLNQDLVIHKDYSYYWLDRYNTVLKATKANLLKILPPNRGSVIEDYLQKNKIDFRNESDLKKLFLFAASIK